MEARDEPFWRGGEVVGAWTVCILSCYSPAITMALHKSSDGLEARGRRGRQRRLLAKGEFTSSSRGAWRSLGRSQGRELVESRRAY